MGFYLCSVASTIFMVVFVALLDLKTKFSKMNNKYRQIIIGILFAIPTCLASEYGLHIPHAIINCRDAAPLCAALFFGGPSGIIAGTIGAVFRLFWGTDLAHTFTIEWITTMFGADVNGGFTRIACTLGTLFAGIIAAILRKHLLEHKRPPFFYAISISLTVEVLHLLLVFVFRLNYLDRVFDVCKACSLPMIFANVGVVAISFVALNIILNEKSKRKKIKDLSTAFQRAILVCVTFAFLVTVSGMALVQAKLSVKQAEATLTKNLTDIKKVIEIEGGIEKYINNNFAWHVGKSGGILIGKINYDANNSISSIKIVLDSEGIRNEEIIDTKGIKNGHVWKTADNFFKSNINLGSEKTEIFGMYDFSEKDYIVITYLPTSEATLYQGVTLYLTIFFEILIFAAIFVFIYYLVKKLVVTKLHEVNETLSEITEGNLNAVVDVRSHDEFISLSDDINHTVDTLKRYIDEAAARIDAELEYARSIQLSSLPNVFPPFPNRTEFEIFAKMDTAKEVGGDFYDFYFVGENKFAFLVADVSGKGIPAAMFMMRAKTTIKGLAESGLSVDEVFTLANEKLCEGNDAGMFVTAFMCVVDLATGYVQFVNAGHNPPLIRKANAKYDFFKPRAGFVLAGMEGVNYKLGELKLEPGDMLYIYTDGVPEATDANNVLFGNERMLEALNSYDGNDCKKTVENMISSVSEFVGQAPQFDDMTMLCFRLDELMKSDTNQEE